MTEHISISEYLKLVKGGKQGGRQVKQSASKNKFRAEPVRDVTGKQTYASKREAKRAGELRLMVKAGLITELKEQPRFPFHDVVYDSGRICTYVADFEYKDQDGERIIEDAKGMLTPVYKIKKALMWVYYKIEVIEV